MSQGESINWEARINSEEFRAEVFLAWPKSAGECNIAQFCGGAIRALYAPTKQAAELYNSQGVREALLEGAENGLYTNDQGGEFDLVVYSDVCQMQMSYRGWHTKAMRTGLFAYINVVPIHENDEVIEFNIGFPPVVNIRPALAKEPGNKLAYVAYGERADGKGIFPPLMMRMKQIFDECRAHSKGWKYYAKMKAEGKSVNPGPWTTHEDSMCRKSVLMKFCKQFTPLNNDASLTKDEYREAGVEHSTAAPKPEAGLNADAPRSATPAPTEEPVQQEKRDDYKPVAAREQPKPPAKPAPAAQPAAAPKRSADESLIYNEAAAVFNEYIKLQKPPEMSEANARKQFRALNFPIDQATKQPVAKLDDLHREHLFEIIDGLAHKIEQQARPMPPLMTAWYKNHSDEIQQTADAYNDGGGTAEEPVEEKATEW